jgi:hypothetical protein
MWLAVAAFVPGGLAFSVLGGSLGPRWLESVGPLLLGGLAFWAGRQVASVNCPRCRRPFHSRMAARPDWLWPTWIDPFTLECKNCRLPLKE